MRSTQRGTPAVRTLAAKFSMLLAAMILVLAVSMILLLRFNVRSRQNRELVAAADSLHDAILQNNSLNAVQNVELPYYVLFAVYNAQSGEVIFTNDPFLPPLPPTHAYPCRYTEKNYFTDGDLDILYYALLHSNDGEYVIQTALNLDTDTASALISDLPKILLIVMLPLLFVSYFAALFISKRTMKSVRDMTETARQISSAQLDMRLPVSNKGDEFDALAQTLNDLLSRLQKDFEREKQFTADVSHELKTPLAVILGHANLLKRWGKDDKAQLEKSLAALASEAHSMEAIITNLLQLSRLESGVVHIQKTRVDVVALFKRLVADTAAWASGVSFSCHMGSAQDASGASATDSQSSSIHSVRETSARYVLADADFLYEACTIIISNSVKFAGEDVHIMLSCEHAERSGFCDIIISDNGPGIASSALPHIFERFYRGDEAHERSVGGSGLGLSIVKSIVQALGGFVRAESLQGQGAKIIMSLEAHNE
ncbi:MAG: HAMP domain-containing protein [Treponema sp.]|nr:HAMP domain-containing protein [Treponema sp.]